MERDLARYWPVFLLPPADAFAIGFLIPFAMGLYLSFCDFTTLSNATFVGFGNYVRAFEDSGGFTHALWYTALFAGLSTVLINLFGLTVALLLVRGFRGTNLFRTVFFVNFYYRHGSKNQRQYLMHRLRIGAVADNYRLRQPFIAAKQVQCFRMFFCFHPFGD